MPQIQATIKGTSALLMHAYPRVEIEAVEKRPKEEQAEHAAYRDPDTKELFIPAVAVQRGLVNAASYLKGKGRASLQKQAAACLLVSPERLVIHNGKGTAAMEYVIDSRPVVIPATKGRVMRHRPRFDEWSVTFTLDYDETLLKSTEVRKIVDLLGSRVGLLDFRPERKGPFGRFYVIEWRE
jgi:hypothetical protein